MKKGKGVFKMEMFYLIIKITSATLLLIAYLFGYLAGKKRGRREIEELKRDRDETVNRTRIFENKILKSLQADDSIDTGYLRYLAGLQSEELR